jgi:hypothetical protein
MAKKIKDLSELEQIVPTESTKEISGAPALVTVAEDAQIEEPALAKKTKAEKLAEKEAKKAEKKAKKAAEKIANVGETDINAIAATVDENTAAQEEKEKQAKIKKIVSKYADADGNTLPAARIILLGVKDLKEYWQGGDLPEIAGFYEGLSVEQLALHPEAGIVTALPMFKNAGELKTLNRFFSNAGVGEITDSAREIFVDFLNKAILGLFKGKASTENPEYTNPMLRTGHWSFSEIENLIKNGVFPEGRFEQRRIEKSAEFKTKKHLEQLNKNTADLKAVILAVAKMPSTLTAWNNLKYVKTMTGETVIELMQEFLAAKNVTQRRQELKARMQELLEQREEIIEKLKPTPVKTSNGVENIAPGNDVIALEEQKNKALKAEYKACKEELAALDAKEASFDKPLKPLINAIVNFGNNEYIRVAGKPVVDAYKLLQQRHKALKEEWYQLRLTTKIESDKAQLILLTQKEKINTKPSEVDIVLDRFREGWDD